MKKEQRLAFEYVQYRKLVYRNSPVNLLKNNKQTCKKIYRKKMGGGGVAKMAQIPTGLSVKYDFKFSFLQLKSIITSNYIIQFCIYTISNYSKFVYLNNLTKIRLFISLFAIYGCLCT